MFVAVVLCATAVCSSAQSGKDPVGTKMLLDGAREGDERKVNAALKRGVWVDEPDAECMHQNLHSAPHLYVELADA